MTDEKPLRALFMCQRYDPTQGFSSFKFLRTKTILMGLETPGPSILVEMKLFLAIDHRFPGVEKAKKHTCHRSLLDWIVGWSSNFRARRIHISKLPNASCSPSRAGLEQSVCPSVQSRDTRQSFSSMCSRLLLQCWRQDKGMT